MALALGSQVWAESPTANSAAAPAPVLQQESFAPLVKKVLPAVVNISVTESGVVMQKETKDTEKPSETPKK